MKYYEVYIGFSVSQVVRVPVDQVDSLEEAIDMAIDDADVPNAGNKFEQDSEAYAMNVRDDEGNLLWERDGDAP